MTTVARETRQAIFSLGLILLIFGILILTWPGVTLAFFTFFFIVFALGGGILAVIAALQAWKAGKSWWRMLVEGLCGIVSGLLPFAWPGLRSLVLVIAGWSIIIGICELSALLSHRTTMKDGWLVGASGAVSLLLGLVLIFWPSAGLQTYAYLLGGYALVLGLILLIYALWFTPMETTDRSHK